MPFLIADSEDATRKLFAILVWRAPEVVAQIQSTRDNSALFGRLLKMPMPADDEILSAEEYRLRVLALADLVDSLGD